MQSRAAGTTVLLLDAPPPASATQLRAYYRRYREDLLPDIQANLMDSGPANTVQTMHVGVPTARAPERDQMQTPRHDATVAPTHVGRQYPGHLPRAFTQQDEVPEEPIRSNVAQFDPHLGTLHYTITITLQETLISTEGRAQTGTSAFNRIVVDTGSSTSWIIGAGYRIAYSTRQLPYPTGSTRLCQMPAIVATPSAASNRATASTTHPTTWAPIHPLVGTTRITQASSANPTTVQTRQPVTYALLKDVPRNPPAGWIPKRVYVNHDYRKDEARTAAARALGRQEEYADETMRIALCNYGSSSAEPTMSVVIIPSHDQTVGLRAWNVGIRTRHRLFSMPYRFAVAIGISEGIYRTAVNGLLALGPCDVQNALRRFGNYPSFLRSLLGQGVLCGTDAGQFDGFIQYYALRRPTQRDVESSVGESRHVRAARENWLALNAWPLGETGYGAPSWSAPIPLSPLGLEKQMWITTLDSISFIELVSGGTAANGTAIVIRQQRGVLRLDTDGAASNVLLDTGSTILFFPDHVLSSLRMEIFGSPWNTAQEGRVRSSNRHNAEDGPQFMVPASINLSNWRAVMAFRGVSDGEIVYIEIPCDPFLAAFDPTSTMRIQREGLIYPLYGTGQTFSILGIPFFQSAYVALHKPDEPMAPYVRIAPQLATGEELSRFALPPYA